MTDDLLIGVDLGTSVVKATLYTAAGDALAHAARPVALRQPAPGIAEQEPDEFVAHTVAILGELVARAGVDGARVAAIACDGQMGGIMGIDRDWRAVTPWLPSTLDDRYLPYLARVEATHGDVIMQRAGSVPIAGPRLLWWREEDPARFGRMAKIVMLAGYVTGRLGGLTADAAFVDPSYLTWFGMTDTGRRAWAPDLVDLWRVDAAMLPRIVPATTVVGALAPWAARASGLRAGTPLVAGAGDQVAGFLGAGLVAEGDCIDVAGTFPVFAGCTDRFVVDTAFGALQSLAGPLGDDHWYVMMYISGGGLTHRWFAREFARDVMEKHGEDWGAVFATLDAEAAAVAPGSDGLLFFPHLGGRSSPTVPHVRGGWLGATWSHTRAHFYRALLESMAYDYAGGLASIRHHAPGGVSGDVTVIGGGARSPLWTQIKADVLGLRYHVLANADRATLGSAIMAGHGVGIFPDMAATAQAMRHVTRTTMPEPARHRRYQPMAAAYRDAYGDLDGIFRRLAGLRANPAAEG